MNKPLLSACLALMLLSACEQKINQSVNPHIQVDVSIPQSGQRPAEPVALPSAQPEPKPTMSRPVPQVSIAPNQPSALPTVPPVPTPLPTAVPTPSPSLPSPALSANWSQPIKANLRENCDSNCKPVFQMSFVDFKTGWAINERNQLSHTQDAGVTWQVQSLGDNRVNSLSFVDQNTGWIAGEKGMIRKTTDGGKTWNVQDSGGSKWIHKIAFFNTESGIFIAGSQVFTSHDGGESWQALSSVNGTYGLSFFKPDGALFFNPGSPSQPVLLDGGMAFPIQGYTSHYNRYIYGVAFQDENTGYLYGGILYKTTDGGRSWQALSGLRTNEGILRVDRDRINSMAFANAQEGLLVTTNSASDKKVFYYTTDGGETWTKSQLTLPSSNFVAVYHMQLFGSLNQGWAFANGIGSGIAQGAGVLYRLGRP